MRGDGEGLRMMRMTGRRGQKRTRMVGRGVQNNRRNEDQWERGKEKRRGVTEASRRMGGSNRGIRKDEGR